MHKDDLIAALQKIEGNPEVYIAERTTEFDFGLANSARLKRITFGETPGGEILAEADVIVISEE